jgi:hypothetical protein
VKCLDAWRQTEWTTHRFKRSVAAADASSVHFRSSLLARSGLLAVATASLLLMLGAAAYAQSSRSPAPLTRTLSSANIALPTPAAARSIVSSLWSQRESALASLNTTKIDPLESASAKQQDDDYINSVRCRCERRKDPHPADRVIPQVPKSSVQPVFFAQVHTTNANTREHLWYVVAVERNVAGLWKLAYINLGGYKAAPPLRWLTNSSGYTLQVTAQSRARMTHLADTSVQYAMTHNKLTLRTAYGATIHRRFAVEPGKDGIYGLTLLSDEVLSCFTLHNIETYSLQSGLQQGPSRSQWGHRLPPGIYTSITIDTAAPMCVAGRGVGKTVGVLRLNYEQRAVATTGVRK